MFHNPCSLIHNPRTEHGLRCHVSHLNTITKLFSRWSCTICSTIFPYVFFFQADFPFDFLPSLSFGNGFRYGKARHTFFSKRTPASWSCFCSFFFAFPLHPVAFRKVSGFSLGRSSSPNPVSSLQPFSHPFLPLRYYLP